MWLWLLIAALNINSTHAAPTSLGPTSPTEAAILWKNGQAAFQAGNFQEAVNRLQRLVDRYPGSPSYEGSLEAYRLLGQSYLLMNQPIQAIPPLKHFTATASAAIPPLEVGQGKLLLGKAYLATGRYHEAYLLSQEFERADRSQTLQAQQALLLKARVLMGQGRYSSAEPLLESLNSDTPLKRATDPQSPDYLELQGELFLAQLDFKLHECGKLPLPGKMDEGQVRLQLERRGVCLQEAVLHYKKRLLDIQNRYLTTAETRLASAFEHYRDACLNPPPPPTLRPKDRTPVQLRKYRDELVAVLKEDCNKSIRSSTELLGKTSRKNHDQ